MFKAHLKLCVLRQLRQQEQSGYDLLAHAITGKKPSAGSVYPLLKELQTVGYVTSHSKGRRKLYRITTKGEKLIASLEKQHDDTLQRMVKTIEPISNKEELEAYLTFRKELHTYKPQLLHDMDVYERLHKAMFRVYDKKDAKLHAKLHELLAHTAQKIEQTLVK